MLREHPGDLPLGDAHMDRVTIPIPEQRGNNPNLLSNVTQFPFALHLEMIFSLFRCFLPLPLISIPFEYLTMVGAERQCIFYPNSEV